MNGASFLDAIGSGYESETVFALFAPAATPTAIVNRLQQEIARIMNRAEVKEKGDAVVLGVGG
jgi:tripartite-type tricarboxylate transporter receptor subunit TctC